MKTKKTKSKKFIQTALFIIIIIIVIILGYNYKQKTKKENKERRIDSALTISLDELPCGNSIL